MLYRAKAYVENCASHYQPRACEHRDITIQTRARVFFKRLSDVWDEEYAAALADTGDIDYARADGRLPLRSGRRPLERCAECGRAVGQVTRDAMRAIEAANPDRLDGIVGDAPQTNKSRLPDAMRKNLLEHSPSRRCC